MNPQGSLHFQVTLCYSTSLQENKSCRLQSLSGERRIRQRQDCRREDTLGYGGTFL